MHGLGKAGPLVVDWPMAIDRIQLLSIPVRDQEVAKAFYVDVLGFDLVRDNPMGPDQRWVEVAPRGAATSMTLVTWFETMPPGSLRGLVLETDDLEGTLTTMIDALRARSPFTQLATKQVLQAMIDAVDVSDLGRAMELASLSSPDLDEGLTAFQEKRAPRFTHRP